ncbi:MAG: universal stress protein [Candidatus Rokubacteria bacterium]|nr:universal stress protein [Candidatus Rokubacteria bacterium]
MYDRILIPLDGSPVAEGILPFAGQIAGPLDSEVVLLLVLEPIPSSAALAGGLVDADALLVRERQARQYLERISAGLEAKGVRVKTEVRPGPAAPTIVATAVEREADLIAMTTHGRSGLGRLLFGSVAERVLRTSPVPVLLMRMTAAERSESETARA